MTTPERVAALVTRWVWLYTLGLPADVRARRLDEMASDLHDHVTDERARGTADRRVALGVLSRMVRGLAADASWRGSQAGARPSTAGARRSLVAVAVLTLALLSVPLVAMQFTADVAWAPFDFVFAGTLIAGTGLLLRAAALRTRDLVHRAAVAFALGATFVLVFAGLAVGMVGEPSEPVNVLSVAVPAVGLVGALAARLRPGGMVRTMLAMASVQALIGGVVLVAGAHHGTGTSGAEVLMLNGFFVTLFTVSALLFRRAAMQLRSRRCAPGTERNA